MLRRLVRLGIDNPVLLDLVFGFVVLAGVLAWVVVPKEEFPQVATDRLVVSAGYPGASPGDVEDQIVRPLEDGLARVGAVEHVYAEATEGRTLLTVELVRGADVEATRDEVERVLDAEVVLPDAAVGPRVSVARLRIPLVHVALLGDPRAVDLAETLADELLEIQGVAEVKVEGASTRGVEVRLVDRRAAALGVGPQAVADALARAGVGLPAGQLDRGADTVRVRTPRGLTDPAGIAAVPLRVEGGTTVRVGDVAEVTWAVDEADVRVRVGGQPAIDLLPLRADDADALRVVPEVRAWVAARRATLPAGLDLVAYDDSARMVADRIEVLASNGLVGLALVGLVLVAFVGVRNAVLVAWGMPVAFLGAIAMLTLVGESINVVSVFGLVLVTGILVDDAVVIVENVERHLERGKDRITAAVDGTLEVAGAVTSATVTTCLAFAPLLMLDGTVGRVMRIVPVAVILSLLASLFEALVVLPGHLGRHARERTDHRPNLPTRWIRAAYAPILERVTRPGAPLPVLVGLLVLLTATAGLATTMRLELTTEGKPVLAFFHLDLPATADRVATTDAVRAVERIVDEEADGLTLYVAGRVGEQQLPQGLPTWGARHGQVKVGFANRPEVLAQVPAALDRIRARALDVPGVSSVDVVKVAGGPPVGRPVDVRVRGLDETAVVEASGGLAAWLRSRPGVHDVQVEATEGPDAWEVRVLPAQAARLGLREAQVAGAVRGALAGVEALDLAVDGRATTVRTRRAEPVDLEALRDLPLTLPGGAGLRLRQVAEVRRVPTAARLSRVDGQRALRVQADLDPEVTSATAVRNALEPAFRELARQDAGVSLFYGGELADTDESFGQLPGAALLAVLLIYVVLAVQFESYLQPLLILAAVPAGAAGMVLGLLAFGLELSFIALIGGVGLVGIVVNDALVLVDFINQARADGMPAREAVVEATLVRLRPVLITTVTTVLGLLPLALGVAGVDPLLAPMAVAISVGLGLATAVTLVLLPVAYLVLDGLAGRRASPHVSQRGADGTVT
ncbi:MAG: efflux RND transporter permease subunit [Alphaproteobacteria bacterium]|nr:efflux RND transporter permease subunit [Alphaproteobacteria bacterium]